MVSLFGKQFGEKKVKRVYLDYAGATEVSERAKRALIDSLSVFGNPSGIHKEGAEAGQLLDKGRVLLASALNAHTYEIYAASSGTESCNLAVIGSYEAFIVDHSSKDGNLPHAIVSSIEHPAVLESIRMLERKKKITVTYLPIYDNGIVKVRDVESALTDSTFLVSVMYANNEVGTIQPIKEIGKTLEEWKKKKNLPHSAYPYFHTDACQAANYCNLDVVRLRVHLMTVNSSKVYGPKGVALLYKREGIKLLPISYGGGQERGLRSGTENAASMYSFGTALAESVALREKESTRLRLLRDTTVASLKKAVPEIVFYGAFDEYFVAPEGVTTKVKAELRLPNNINCRVPGITSEEMILRLDAKGFSVSHKSACASMETEGSYVVMALGAKEEEALENIRISMGRSTTEAHMESFVEAFKSIVEKYRKTN